MIKNIFPQFLKEPLSSAFASVSTTAMMVEIDDVAHWLPEKHNSFLLKEWLSASELEILHSFKMQKRQAEWLAGRICAKMAASNFIHSQHGNHLLLNQIIIANEPSGRPSINWPKPNSCSGGSDLSISHSAKYAFALVANRDCGIDIQEPKSTLLRVKKRFCSEMEETLVKQLIMQDSSIPALTLLWAAKEAIRKAYSVHFIPEFRQLQINSARSGGADWWHITFSHTDISPTVICGFHNGYGIAICIAQGQTNAGTP